MFHLLQNDVSAVVSTRRPNENKQKTREKKCRACKDKHVTIASKFKKRALKETFRVREWIQIPYLSHNSLYFSIATLTEEAMVCGRDRPQPFTLPCSSLSHPGSRVLHGTSTSRCPDGASLPLCLSPRSHLCICTGKGGRSC